MAKNHFLFYFIYFSFLFQVIAGDSGSVHHREKQSLPPAVFYKNKGQWDENVLYQGSSKGANVIFMKDGLCFGYAREYEIKDENDGIEDGVEMMVWKMQFLNTTSLLTITSEGEKSSNVSYFKGNDRSRFAPNIPVCNQINYNNIYHNINLRYYNNGKKLKYDYLLKPGADISHIRMGGKGIKKFTINRSKQLQIETDWGILLEEIPYSYQVIHQEIHPVDVSYKLINDTIVGFTVNGNYNPAYELVIDPIVLDWSTFGGALDVDQVSYQLGLDRGADGYLYATGKVVDFKTTVGAYRTSSAGLLDAFVYKMTPDGKTVVYATYFGGSADEWACGIAVNAAGEAFVGGWTTSPNLPVRSAFQGTPKGKQDGFIFRMNAAGNDIIYSTYFGGSNEDYIGHTNRNTIGNCVAVNANNEAYIAGYTKSTNFPGITTMQGFSDAFVAKLKADGSGYVFSDVFGGQGSVTGEIAKGIAVNGSGDAFVCGYTLSSNIAGAFPTTPGAYCTVHGDLGDGFVRRYSTSGTLIYSTLLKGTSADDAVAIDVNATDEAYVVGGTSSTDIGASNTITGAKNTFVQKLSADGKSLIWATYVGNGNSPDEIATGIDLSSSSEIFVTGWTKASSFPLNCEIQSVYGGHQPTSSGGDVVVYKLSPSGQLEFSTYYGGSNSEYGSPKIKLWEKNGCVIQAAIGLTTHSFDYKTTAGAYITVKPNSDSDQPAIFALKPVVEPDFEFTQSQGCTNAPVQFTDKSKGACIWKPGNWQPSSWNWDFGDGQTATVQNPVHSYAPGTYNVTLRITCPDTVVKKIIVIPPGNNATTVNIGRDTTLCSGQTVIFDAGNPGGVTYLWSSGATTQTITVNNAGTYSVILDNGGCKAYDTVKVDVLSAMVNLVYTPVCVGDSVLLDAGNPVATYQWNTGSTIQSIYVSNPGAYSVTVTISTCTATGTIDIVFNQPPSVALHDTALCGVSVNLDAGSIPGATYLWSNGSTGQAITATTSGTYYITVDRAGCKASDTAVVNFVTSTSSSAVVNLCDGEAYQLLASVPGDTYQWNTGAAISTISVSNAGAYWVKITNAGTCDHTDTFNVTVTSFPSLAWINDTVCEGVPVVIDAGNPGSSYLWNTGATTRTITVTNPGVYSVDVANGRCNITAQKAVVHNPHPLIDLGDDISVCDGNSVKLSASVTPGTSYVWSTGETGTVITVTKPGEYMLTAEKNGCAAADTIEVFYQQAPKPIADISVCDISNTTLDAANTGSTYLWNTGETTQTITIHSPGTYWVEISKSGCVLLDTIEVEGEIGGFSLFIPNSFTPNEDGKNEFFTAYGTGIIRFEMLIFNRWGELFFQTNNMNRGWDGKSNGTTVQEDVYVYIIKYTTACGNQKLGHEKLGHVSVIR